MNYSVLANQHLRNDYILCKSYGEWKLQQFVVVTVVYWNVT